jgi:hypothetical protein
VLALCNYLHLILNRKIFTASTASRSRTTPSQTCYAPPFQIPHWGIVMTMIFVSQSQAHRKKPPSFGIKGAGIVRAERHQPRIFSNFL